MDVDFSKSFERMQGLLNYFLVLLPGIAVGLVVLAGFYFAGKGMRVLVQRYHPAGRRRRNLGLVVGRLAQGVTVVLGILVAATVAFPTFTPGDLFQVLGLGSVAIGFAFRDVLQNYLAGVLLLITEPFRIGDQIIYDKYEGTVEDIQTRATFIRTYDGRRAVIPNSNLFTNAVLVNTAFDRRRWEYDVGIGVGDDVETAKRVIRDAIATVPDVLKDPPPQTLVVDLADFSVKIRVWWWTEPPQRLNVLQVQDEVLAAVKKALIDNGIDLPFPTHQVLLHDQTEETDGDRRRQREGWPAGNGEVPRPRALRESDLGRALRQLAGAAAPADGGRDGAAAAAARADER